ncbi:MAG: Holliday junction resolvase RuvX, partial [Chloroflexota bacterium]
GLDVGERRIGVARGDPSGLLASPLTTIMRTSDRVAIEAIRSLVAEHGAHVLVVGLPLTAEGDAESLQAQRIAAFGRRLRAIPGMRVVFWSERYSTATAGEHLGVAGRRAPPRTARQREASRRRLDAAAAAVILQDYLDQQRQVRQSGQPAQSKP